MNRGCYFLGTCGPLHTTLVDLSDWTLNGIDCTLFDTAEEVRREFYMDKVHYLTTYMYEHVACQVTT